MIRVFGLQEFDNVSNDAGDKDGKEVGIRLGRRLDSEDSSVHRYAFCVSTQGHSSVVIGLKLI